MGEPTAMIMLRERRNLLSTLSQLDDATFETGSTLCDGWAPRDVLAHLIGIDEQAARYVLNGPFVNRVNAEIIDEARRLSRDQIMAQAARWGGYVPFTSRAIAFHMLGDLGIHHLDIAVPNNVDVVQDPRVEAAAYRVGALMGARKLLNHKLVPTDHQWTLGRGTTVEGPCALLGVWASGRDLPDGLVHVESKAA
ncbi:MAG: maleylpyruvate isomerase family mycothiol-dependent enzyme [Actinobacteria bacterium]|nr:maleylpyruvate isomerase family mycothiol-dependent enzyme [Actinomycetota bacterium]MCB9388699.1 maleylpyruvate isomerase family mycothiol-dependent enzyme [Acidimicrobiia bacterium]